MQRGVAPTRRLIAPGCGVACAISFGLDLWTSAFPWSARGEVPDELRPKSGAPVWASVRDWVAMLGSHVPAGSNSNVPRHRQADTFLDTFLIGLRMTMSARLYSLLLAFLLIAPSAFSET